MSLEEYIEYQKNKYAKIMRYIEQSSFTEDDFQNIAPYFKYHNKYELIEDLDLINNISNNHHKVYNFFPKIERILTNLQNDIKSMLSNDEIFVHFYNNKRILLFLLKNKFLNINQNLFERWTNSFGFLIAKYQYYFFKELKEYSDESSNEQNKSDLKEFADFDEIVNIINNHLNEYEQERLNGENNTELCSIIRKDSLEDFKSYIEKENLELTSDIVRSYEETNQFLLYKTPKLIEYAAFCGSIKIFQYLMQNLEEFDSSSIMTYAIHSQNFDFINFLENSNIKPDINSYKEAIKCHYNDIAAYIRDKYLSNESEIDEICFKYYLHYHNYSYFPSQIKNEFNFLYNACKYNYYTICELLLKTGKFNINEKVDISIENEKYCKEIKETLLFIASKKGNHNIVNLLLQQKDIDINVNNNSRIKQEIKANTKKTETCSPLFIALEKRFEDVVRLLLARPEIDVNCKGIKSFIDYSADKKEYDSASLDEMTPLYLAIKESDIIFTKMLLSAPKIDVNAKSKFYSIGYRPTEIITSPIFCAVEKRNVEIVNLLLECNEIDLNETVSEILDSGIDIRAKIESLYNSQCNSDQGEESKSDRESDSVSNSKPKTESKSETEAESKSEPESEPESKSESEPESKSESEPESKSESEPESKSESEPESKSESEPESKSESEPESKSESEPESKSESEPESKSESEPESKSESNSETGTDSKAEPKSESESESESESKSESESESKSELNTKPEKVYKETSYYTVLKKAVFCENLEIIRLLVSNPKINLNTKLTFERIDGNETETDESTVLITAFDNNKIDIVKILLDQPKIDVNTVSIYERKTNEHPIHFLYRTEETLLYKAIDKENLEIFHLLLSHSDIDVNVTSTFRNEKRKKYLLFSKGSLIHMRNKYVPIIFEAFQKTEKEFINALLSHPKIDVTKEYIIESLDEDNPLHKLVKENILHASIKNSWPEITEKILAFKQIDVNDKDINGDKEETPLMLAIQNKDIQTVKMLLSEEKIDLNMKSFSISGQNQYESTPLCFTVFNNFAEGFDLLIDRPDVDVNAFSTIHTIERGESIDFKKKFIATVLHYAMYFDVENFVQKTIQRNEIDVNLIMKEIADFGTETSTPSLYLAVQMDNYEYVKYLLSKKDINVNENMYMKFKFVPDMYMSPLHKAVLNGNTSIIQLLLDQDKIDINQKNYKGLTPEELVDDDDDNDDDIKELFDKKRLH